MTRNIKRLPSLLAVALLGLGSPLLGCHREDKSSVEKLGDKAKDALDVREHEKLKDAGEDVKDAAKDAAEGVKDAAKDAGAAVKEEAESAKEKAK
jgi:hypothetical protein